jgi:hypothetical protein
MPNDIQTTDLAMTASPLFAHVSAIFDLTKTEARRLHERLWRFSAHLRQPRKDDRSCNKTPYFNRWDTNDVTSYITPEDPRYATEETCRRIYETLLALLLEAHGIPASPAKAQRLAERTLGRALQPQSLACVQTGKPITQGDIKRALHYVTQRLGTFEIPTAYRVGLDHGGRHDPGNVGWMKPLHINYILRDELHAYLARANAPRNAIKNALDKIQVKAYATDKQTMPPHFSNRDVRWATWPESVQYTSHYECAMIEMELMVELFEFVGAPPLSEDLHAAILEVRGRPLEPGTRRCYVTGTAMDFDDYVQAAVTPRGGKSAYHVGHILPLTRGGRHEWRNIAWLSDDGNRIQGNDTLDETEDKLLDAVEYHLRRDVEREKRPKSFVDRITRLWDLLNDIREKLGRPRRDW